MPETTTTYAKIVATKVTGLLAEFSKIFRVTRSKRSKNVVTGFFLQRRIRHDSGQDIQKTSVYLAMATHTGIDFFTDLPIDEFIDVAKEVNDIGKQKQSMN